MLNIPIRPITSWPGKETGEPRYSTFRKTYKATLVELEYELDKANVVSGSVILEMWVRRRVRAKEREAREQSTQQ